MSKQIIIDNAPWKKDEKLKRDKSLTCCHAAMLHFKREIGSWWHFIQQLNIRN